MLTLDVLSKRLGLSEWQTRRMVYALRPLLQELQTSKPGQALQIPSSSIGVFERAAQLKSEGHSLPTLAKVLQEEMQENSKATATPQSTSQEQPLQEHLQESASPLAEPWRLVIEAKNEQLAEMRERIAFLEARIEKLEPLALPKPRKPFLARLFKPIVIAGKGQ